ncbi:MAG TPA: nucleoside hydrolase [Actinopolymorphaceae bacterium]
MILDTDIGTDVDDALALAMLFGAPDVDLLAVTTVYGNVAVRAQIARRLARLAGRDALAVVPGKSRPLSGGEPWWAGFEGRLYADLECEAFAEDLKAPEFLVERVVAAPGEIDIVATGPLTNIAAALRADPRFASSVRMLYVMGGRYDGEDPIEHNFRSDAVAAAEVFASGIPVTVVGLEVTTQVRIGPDELATIAAAGALGRQLEAEVHQWWDYTGREWNHPHDPLAVLAMLRPDLVGMRRAKVRVEPRGENAGRCVTEPFDGTESPESFGTCVVDSVKITPAVTEIVELVEAAGHQGPSA